MQSWKEAEQIYTRIQERLQAGQSVALATVIRIEGSTYRRPGARLLIEQDGQLTGNVSGGCLEQDVREVGMRVLASGQPEVIHYETGSEEDVLWGMGMGCDGKMDIFLQKLSGPNPAVGQLVDCFASAKECVLALNVDEGPQSGQHWVSEGSATPMEPMPEDVAKKAKTMLADESTTELCEIAGERFFLEVFRVPPSLILCGAGDDAIPLSAYALDMGLRVTVVDHRPAYLGEKRFPDPCRRVLVRPEEAAGRIQADENAMVVIKTRSIVYDEAWLRFFAETPACYIGLLGPRARREKLMSSLAEEQRSRVYGPVGLDIGAEIPEQVAVSIVAELLAVASGRHGGHLRGRKRAIHDT